MATIDGADRKYILQAQERKEKLAKEVATRWENEKRNTYHAADRKFVKTSPQPERIVDIYKEQNRTTGLAGFNLVTGAWDKGPIGNITMSKEQLSGIPPLRELMADQRQRAVDNYEKAYYKFGESIPMSWWLSQSATDLELLLGESNPDTLQDIYATQRYIGEQEKYDAAVQAEVDARFDTEMRGRSAFGQFMRGLGNFAGAITGAVTLDDDRLVQNSVQFTDAFNPFGGLSTTLPEDETALRAELRRQVEAEVRNGSPEATAGFLNTVMGWGVSGATWVGHQIGNAVSFTSKLSSSMITAGNGESMYDVAKRNFDEEKEEQIALVKKRRNLNQQGVLDKYKFQQAETAFAQMEIEDPALYEEFILMAGGDRLVAMGIFGSQIDDELEASEQMAMLREQEEKDYQGYIQQLEEADYRPSADVMEGLAAYGTHIPMRLATSATLMLTDGDALQDAVTGRWGELWSEVEKNEFSPANVLGLENTAVGLMLDLGAGIAFDPTTWIFGPRAAGTLGRATSASEAMALADSAFAVRAAKDMARLRRSASHGTMEVAYMGSWLDEVGLMGEALEILGIRSNKVLGGRAWRKDDARALYSQEVRTDTIIDMLDDVDLAHLDEVGEGSKAIDDLGESLKKSGFNRAIELEYSLEDGTIRLSDGAKRLLAARKIGVDSVPVTIRVKSTPRSASMPKVAGMTGDDVAHLADLATGRIKSQAGGQPPNMGNMFRALAKADRDLQGKTGFRPLKSLQRKLGKKKTVNMELRQLVQENADGSARTAYYIVDDSNNVVAGAIKEGNETLHVWTDEAWRKQGLQNELFDTARAEGDELLLASGRDQKQLFADGATNAQAQAKRFFTENGIDVDSLPVQPRGKRLADLAEEGDVLPKHSTKVDDYEPNVGDSVYVRPDKLLSEKQIFGDIDFEALQGVFRTALERGAVMPSATRLSTAANWNGRLRSVLRGSNAGKWLERYMSPQGTVTRLELYGATATARINETAVRLWGANTEKLDYWMGRLMDVMEQQAKTNRQFAGELAELSTKRTQLQALQDLSGGGWDDAAKLVGGEVDDAAVAANRKQVMDQARKLEEEIVREQVRLDEAFKANTPEGLDEVVLSMWDDYNRTHIATNPAWAGRVDETGMVPWEELRKGMPSGESRGASEGVRRALSEDQLKAAAAADIENPDALWNFLSSTADVKTGVELPLSPLEAVIASEVGGAAYTRLTQTALGHGLREAANVFHLWWVVDKVFSIGTAATVSMDELQRIFHYGGMDAVRRWMGDKVIGSAARAQALRHGKFSAKYGMEHLPKEWQKRLNDLGQYPTLYKQAERQAFEGMGLGFSDISPGEAGYNDAARRMVAGLTSDSGFRAYMGGEEAFKAWWNTPDAARMRRATVMRRGSSSVVSGWKEAYEGWDTMLNTVILHSADDASKAKVLAELKKVVSGTEAIGGGRALEIPDWVLQHLGEIRGVRKQAPNKRGMTAITDAFFDKMFMSPVNYRRGFIADTVRRHETRRLENLFLDQGKTLIPDSEIARVLGLDSYGSSLYGPMRKQLHKQAWDAGFVSQGYIDDLVEFRVTSEVDNILFSWDHGSRAGAQTKAAFPFARPWADMAGFWGNEVLSRPAVRETWRKAGPFGDAAQALADRMPFNPKPLAMASRLAATDFSVDESAPGVGLPFGAESADFSPLLFFPTEGDNPFVSTLPGLGLLPLWAIDRLIQNKYDPIDNPLEYQRLVDSVSDFIPSIGYQRGGVLGRLLGGGTTSAGIEAISDIFGGTTGRPFFNLTSELGDIGREINRSREVSALMADPQELEALLSITDPEAFSLAVEALAHEAGKRSSAAHLSETVSRKVLPIAFDFDETLDQINGVWVDTGAQFGDVLGLGPDWKPADPTDEEAVRQQAADVRTAFFNLEQWQRDLVVAQNPSVAVNLVSSWEFTPLGISELGVEAASAYRTDGTRVSRARHQLYVDNNYIRPIEPITRILRIVGLQQASKESAAKEAYTATAGYVNDQLWEGMVSDDTKATLESIAQSQFGQDRGFQTGREVWQAWGSLEAELEDVVARENGITEEMKAWDKVKETVSIPTKEKAWGSSWPGMAAGTSARFGDLIFNELPEQVTEIAEGLGLELQPGITGTDLFREISRVLTESTSVAAQVAAPVYQEYLGDRSVGKSAWEATLNSQAHNPSLDEEWRTSLSSFLQMAGRVETRMFESEGNLPMSEAQAVVDAYNKLRMTAPRGVNIAWTAAWEGRYQRSFGSLDWTPPVPPPATLEDGSLAPNAYQPYVQAILDGDTLIVSENVGPKFFGQNLGAGKPQMKSVRLLGVFAREMGDEGGMQDRSRLVSYLENARNNDTPIYLVRDPATFGTNTDTYGRELAWLVVGDEPFYFPEELDRSISEGANN